MNEELIEIPLFPLNAVLYPQGRLRLKIFEQRYLDMAKTCFKQASPFGVCLIRHGRETGEPAIPEAVGTLARIIEWDMPQLGVLNIIAEGEQRFRVIDYRAERSGLLQARVAPLQADPQQSVPEEHAALVSLLKLTYAERRQSAPPPPHDFDDATWVSYRAGELLPLHPAEKQQLLECDNSPDRLALIHRYLMHRGLLSA